MSKDLKDPEDMIVTEFCDENNNPKKLDKAVLELSLAKKTINGKDAYQAYLATDLEKYNKIMLPIKPDCESPIEALAEAYNLLAILLDQVENDYVNCSA